MPMHVMRAGLSSGLVEGALTFCRHERVLGGEWWVQRRDEKEDIGFHHDKDEALASNQATMKFPEVGTNTATTSMQCKWK